MSQPIGSTGKANPLARQRYQKGNLSIRGKKKVWVARWREDVMTPQGTTQRRHRSVVLGDMNQYPTKRLAQRALDDLLGEVNALDYKPKVKSLFSEFANQWQANVMSQHRESSQKAEAGHIRKHICPFFKEMELRRIDLPLLQEFISSIPGEPKTVRNVWSTLRNMWASARSWGYTDLRIEGIKLPKLHKHEPPMFSPEEMQQIISIAKGQYKLMFSIAAETQMRIGEILALRWEDIDYSRCILHVRQSAWEGQVGRPKSDAGSRDIEISEGLRSRIREFRTLSVLDVPYLFHNPRGGVLVHNSVYGTLRRLLNKLGIKRSGMHAFRHGGATILVSSGQDLRTIAARLGHSDPATTMRIYAHASRQRSRDMAEMLSRVLAPTAAIGRNNNLQPVANTESVPNHP